MASSNLLDGRPHWRRQCEVGRENGDRDALLPLGEDHRDVDAPALLVELDRARKALCGRAGGQVHRANCLSDLDLVRHTRGFKRFREDRRMPVAAQRVLRQEWLAGLLLETIDKFLLALYWPIGDAE